MTETIEQAVVDRAALQRRTLTSLRMAQVPGQAAVAGMVAVVTLLASDMLGSDRLAGIGSASFTLGAALTMVPLAAFMRRRGRRPGMTAALLIGAAGGAIAALQAQGMNIPVSGQDGDHAALNRVARGSQNTSVWKDARQLGAAAGNIAASLADGVDMSAIDGAVKWSGGAKGVEMDAIFLAPTPIDKTNINIVIEAGHIAKAKVCEGAMAGVNGC